MVGDVMLAGFRLTREEWDGLDDESKKLLLHICSETSPPRVDDTPYEQFELQRE